MQDLFFSMDALDVNISEVPYHWKVFSTFYVGKRFVFYVLWIKTWLRISINENAMKTNEHIKQKKKIDFFASVYLHIFVSSMYMIFKKTTRLVLIFLPPPPPKKISLLQNGLIKCRWNYCFVQQSLHSYSMKWHLYR